jgi:hypothetical protein
MRQGFLTPGGLSDSRTGELADSRTGGLSDSRTGELADWRTVELSELPTIFRIQKSSHSPESPPGNQFPVS